MNKYKALKRSLSVPALKERIWQWIGQRAHLETVQQGAYKFPLSRIAQLTDQFIADWILYAYFAKFNWTLRQFDPTHSLLLSYQLKLKYNAITQKQPIDDFAFNFIVVYCVQLIGRFLTTCIEHIQIDTLLHSELCIIFHHVLIGICVGTKTFSILQQKYCFANSEQSLEAESRKSLIKKSPANSTHTPITNKLITTKLITTKLISTHFRKQHSKTKPVRTSIASSHCQHIDHFIALLKKSLYVESLPEVKNKISAREYDELHEAPQKEPLKLRTYLQSTQVSAASEIECLEKGLARSVGASAKIAHSLQSKPFQKVEALFRKTAKQQAVRVPNENSPSCNAKPLDWNQIIRQIKNIQIARAQGDHRNFKKQLKALRQSGSELDHKTESKHKNFTEHLPKCATREERLYHCFKTDGDGNELLPSQKKEMKDSLLRANVLLQEPCELRTDYENRSPRGSMALKDSRLMSLCQNNPLRDSPCFG